MTKIEWVRNSSGEIGKTWNPVAGCSIVSAGCANCYAMRMAHRLEHMDRARREQKCTRPLQTFALGHYHGLTQVVNGNPVWTGKLALAPPHIRSDPLRRRKPTTYFVNSMSDLFHENINEAWIDQVFAVMALAKEHTFQILTKRASGMRAYMTDKARYAQIMMAPVEDHPSKTKGVLADFLTGMPWPLPNVWLGVSAERQKEADERIPHLLNTPAVIRFVSAEPLLGPIDFTDLRKYNHAGHPWIDGLRGLVTHGDYLARSPSECCHNTSTQVCPPELPGLDWIIVGGESGPGARAFDVDWARSIIKQCGRASVPCFVKQIGAIAVDSSRSVSSSRLRTTDRKGGSPREWPEDLRIRQMPGWL